MHATNGRYGRVSWWADARTGCFADRCDWRRPKLSELPTILAGPEAAPGQAMSCFYPCVDPGFTHVGGIVPAGGPTALEHYGSSSTVAGSPNTAWFAAFLDNFVDIGGKTYDTCVRAVRVGACN